MICVIIKVWNENWNNKTWFEWKTGKTNANINIPKYEIIPPQKTEKCNALLAAKYSLNGS